MKLRSIKCENFRILKNHCFEFKPLTILTGPNSSGKSTVVKALILLQENLRGNRLGRLVFRLGNHRLGSFESVLHHDAPEDGCIAFQLTFGNDEYAGERNLLKEVSLIDIELKYEKDSINAENALLSLFKVFVKEEKENSRVEVLSVKKSADSYVFYVNIYWFAQSVLEDDFSEFKPRMYKIWDNYVTADDIRREIKRRQMDLEAEKQAELEKVENDLDDELRSIVDRINEIEADLEAQSLDSASLEEKIFKHQKEIEEKCNEEIAIIRKQIKEVEEEEMRAEEKGYEEDAISLVELRHSLLARKEDLERRKSDELAKLEREFNEEYGRPVADLLTELKSLKYQYDEIVKNKESKINEHFENEKSHISEGIVRTSLYEQLKDAAINIIKSLRNKNVKESFSFASGDLTIPEFLINTVWEDTIYGLIEKETSREVVDVVSWSSETKFIKERLKERPYSFSSDRSDSDDGKGGSLKFYDIIGKGNENQIVQSIVEKIRWFIELLFSPLPFSFIGALRGEQQRIYRLSPAVTPLERALEVLLSLQQTPEDEKLNFIQKWLRNFGIIKADQKLVVKIIDGAFVEASLESEQAENCICIADLGLGVVQLIPIVIFVADALRSNKLICIEEPGTHLHPNMQTKLVEFVNDAIKHGVHFLLETHSEYFIRKLQYEVVHKQGFAPEDVLIRYLNPVKNEDASILINEEGDLVDEDNCKIEGFGEGFLDEASMWVFKKNAERELKKGKKIFVCEGSNSKIFDALGFSDCIFWGEGHAGYFNSQMVFNFVTDSNIFGVRDRDFLTDQDIALLEESLPNLRILRYYAYENYIYHPDNVFSLLSENVNFDKSDYIDLILKAKNKNYESILMVIRSARNSYKELEYLRKNGGLKEEWKSYESRQVDTCHSALKSDEFEVCYKFFNVKKFFKCRKKILQGFNISEGDLCRSEWFKNEIKKVLKLK